MWILTYCVVTASAVTNCLLSGSDRMHRVYTQAQCKALASTRAPQTHSFKSWQWVCFGPNGEIINVHKVEE